MKLTYDWFLDAQDRLRATGIRSAAADGRAGVPRWWREFSPESVRLTRGVWVLPGGLPEATLLVAHVLGQFAPNALVGVRSAAALHGLLEAPDTLDFIAPRDGWRTHCDWPFAHRRFTVSGMADADQVVAAPLEPGLELRATTAARTLVDLVRFRSVVSSAIAALALRRFLDLGGDVAALEHLALALRAKKPLRAVLVAARHLPPPPPVRDCRPLAFPPGLPEEVPPAFRPGR